MLAFTLLLLLKCSVITFGYGERTKDQMYEYFDGKMSCFRRLNATRQVGCSSKRDGSTGVIHFLENSIDLDFILKHGNAGDYMPVMPVHLLTPGAIKQMQNSEKVSGVVLYNQTTHFSKSYSHELACPNSHFNLEDTCSVPWNEPGSGILHDDLPFPIYYIDNNEDLQKVRDCFNKFNNFSYEEQYTRSLCAVELDAFMYATTDTPTCIRRSNSKTNLNPVKFCDPLGGENIWASLFPLENITEKQEAVNYIVVAARLDTTSMFHGSYPGAVSPITGFVTLLATADLLKRMVGTNVTYDKNILFMLFNGEAYDYIGSQRMVYDMQEDDFPMRIDPYIKYPMPLIHVENISLFVELSQLTRSNALHVYMTDNDPQIKSFYKKLYHYGKNFTTIKQEGSPLPPASLHSFRKARSNISGLILADHSHQYVNKYYTSIYDNYINIDYNYYNLTEDKLEMMPHNSIQRHTANISEMLALSLFEEVMQYHYNGSEKPRLEIVDELYNCYLLDPDCKVHQAVQRKKLRETPHNSYSLYVGVTVVPNLLTYAIGLTLGWLTGDIVTTNKTCVGDPHVPVYQYFNMSKSLDNLNSTVCFRTTMNFTEAVSPAFVIEDYDWKSGKYSSWTESTWKDLTVRMFLKPSAMHERFTLAIGSATLVISLILVYFIKSRSHILFMPPENCSPTSC